MWATWRLETEVTVLNGEDRNRFPSVTQCFPGENIRQFETVYFAHKKVNFLHYKYEKIDLLLLFNFDPNKMREFGLNKNKKRIFPFSLDIYRKKI